MLSVKVNVEGTEDKVIDLSYAVKEGITDYAKVRFIGDWGICRELQHSIDIFTTEANFIKDLGSDLLTKDNAVIYMDDRDDVDCKYDMFIILNDESWSCVFQEDLDRVKGTTAMAVKYLLECYVERKMFKSIDLIDISSIMCSCSVRVFDEQDYDFDEIHNSLPAIKELLHKRELFLLREDDNWRKPYKILTKERRLA